MSEVTYDKDGFIELKFIGATRGRPTALVSKVIRAQKRKCEPPVTNTIGEFKLITNSPKPIDTMEQFSYDMVDRKIEYVVNAGKYSVQNGNKSWQMKAWKQINGLIDWSAPCPLRDASGSSRMRHLKAIAISLRVVATGNPKVKDKLLDSIGGEKSYRTAVTAQEMAAVMNYILAVCHPKQRALYASLSEKARHTCVRTTAKVMMVYDDHSYDHMKGNPLYMLRLLDAKISDWKVVL